MKFLPECWKRAHHLKAGQENPQSEKKLQMLENYQLSPETLNSQQGQPAPEQSNEIRIAISN